MVDVRTRFNAILVFFILLFSLIFVTPLFVQRVRAVNTVYYVSNTGNDGNTGLAGDDAHAWKTIGKVTTAMGDGTIQVGDDVLFKRGDTWTATDWHYLYVRKGGTVSNWMIIGAYGSGDAPVIDGDNVSYYGVSLAVEKVSYVRIENLVFIYQAGYGIRCENFNNSDIYVFNVTVSYNGDNGMYFDQCSNITVENCTVHDIHTGGIVFYGSAINPINNGRILNCTTYNCGLVTTSDGIIIHSGDGAGTHYGQNFLVKGCLSYGNSEQGYDFYGERGTAVPSGNIYMKDCVSHHNTLGGVDLGGCISNVTIDGFLSYNDSGNFGIAPGDGINELIIRNSAIYNTYKYSILTYSDYGYYDENLSIYNNDFVADDYSLGNAFIFFSAYSKNIVVKNNIFLSLDTSAPSSLIRYSASNPNSPSETNSVYVNNMYWDKAGAVGNQWYYDASNNNWAAWVALAETTGELRDDPEFGDAVGHDFSLNDTSPCIDAGDWLTFTVGGGTGTTITLDDASYFTDGYGMISGDLICINNDYNLMITDVDYTANTITVDRSITWVDGENVSLTYNGISLDIGAEEYINDFNDLVIPSDSDFDYAHGVRYGSGTTSDPYMICNWTIQNLTVYSTTKNFTIQNCTVEYHINITSVSNESLIEINDVSMDGTDAGKHSMCWIIVNKAGTITLHNNSFVNLAYSFIGW